MRSVKVARHRGPNGKLLSAGFGFVECSSEQAARAALKRLQASSLIAESHSLHASWSFPVMLEKTGEGASRTQRLCILGRYCIEMCFQQILVLQIKSALRMRHDWWPLPLQGRCHHVACNLSIPLALAGSPARQTQGMHVKAMHCIRKMGPICAP